MKLQLIASVLLALPYAPQDIEWRNGSPSFILWPNVVWCLPEVELMPYIDAAKRLGINYGFAVV